MSNPRRHVIKVGGSLFAWDRFPAALSAFLERFKKDQVVIVAGGGGAADVIRDLDRTHAIGEEAAHWLAVRSLELTAHIVATLVEGVTVVEDRLGVEAAWEEELVPALAPFRFLREDPDPLPDTWSCTTDSIAARVAERMGADELVLLKSVTVPEETSLDLAAVQGWVDPVFPGAAKRVPRVRFVNLRMFNA